MTARAYLRTDPGIWRRKVVEQRYPAALFAAFQAVLCLAEEQPDRGRFRSERLLRLLLDEPKDGVRVLWGRHVTELVRRGDLVRLADGTLYVDGWDEWQEGDVTVRERMQRLLAARAAGMGQDEIEGGDTGLLVRKVKTVQLLNGVSITRSEAFEYELDAALLREMRELEKQAAMEVGQWTEKNQNTTEAIIREYGGFDASKV